MARDTQTKPKFPALRSVPVTGNLTRNPREITGGENTGAGFAIAVNSRNYKGEEFTEFFDITIWGYWADAVLAEYERGERVTVIGDVYFDEYEGKRQFKMDGREISKTIYPPDGGGRSSGGRSSRRDDEDEDEPRSSSRGSRRSRDDDDDDERPARRSRRSSRSDDGDDLDA